MMFWITYSESIDKMQAIISHYKYWDWPLVTLHFIFVSPDFKEKKISLNWLTAFIRTNYSNIEQKMLAILTLQDKIQDK